MGTRLLAVGITGKRLTGLERALLEESSPYAVVLFGRNVDTPQQLQDLVGEIKSSPTSPLIMMDEEGGRVDRLRDLLPGLPSAEAFGEGFHPDELVESFGKVIGGALQYFGIDINLAPVVDIQREESTPGLERRCFGKDPETVIRYAEKFMDGHDSRGVASCLKHFPGLGFGSGDPHYGATVIGASKQELIDVDLVPYVRLGNRAKGVMIGHGTYPQLEAATLPASLSHLISTHLLRDVAGFQGAAFSDDMEMHAVSDLGTYEQITEGALMAGNDVIMFCSQIERARDISVHLAKRASEDEGVGRRFDEALERANGYRQHCAQLKANASPVPSTFEALTEELVEFLDAFDAARDPDAPVLIPSDGDRRRNLRSPGTGKTGREEWT